jgi:hypothetical protein
MQEEELLKWEIGTLTTRQRSYRAPSRLKIRSTRAFAYLLESVSSAFPASNVPVYGPFLTPGTCHESHFSHLRPFKGLLPGKNGEIPTYTHSNEWQSCFSRALLER